MDAKTQQKNRIKPLLWVLVASFLTAMLLFYYHDGRETEQSLTYFPDDPTLTFLTNETSLTFQQGAPYTIQLKVRSKVNHPTYLRQDVSLLYKDDHLIGILSQWKQNTNQLIQKKDVKEKQAGVYEAITVHHAENHYPGGTIRGKETMSYDHLSVMPLDQSGYSSFNIPTTTEEKTWSKSRWNTMQLKQKTLISRAAKEFHINQNDYYIFPLTYLHVYTNNALPGLNQATTQRVISQLWEGIYKSYVLGVQVAEQDIRDPIGSAAPLIFYSKKADHFLVIIQLKTGEITMLKQQI